MATTQTSKEFVGTGDGVNGTDLTWPYTFQSYQASDIKVRVTDSSGTFIDVTNFTVPDWSIASGTVTFNNTGVNSNVCESTGAPKSGRTIRIFRETDITTGVVGQIEPKATYTAGSSVKAEDLNANQKQVLYAIHELRDQERITVNLRNSSVVGSTIRDDEVDSQHYAAGSIDLEHMSANSVDSDQYVDGSIDLIHMSANSVDSDQYVDGSIDLVHLSANSVDSSKIVNGSITNDDISNSAAIAGTKIAAGTTSVPGTMSAADKTKLDGIETAATADQTDAEIRAAVEAATDSNVFTDADHSKLNAIEASADVTDATNVNAAGAVMNSDLDGKGEILIGDGSGDPTALPVGTDNYILTADSSEATGVKWAANAGGGGGSGASEAFKTISVSGQNNVVADSATDTLTLAAGSNITLTTNDSTDTVTIAASGGEVTVQDEGSALSTAATTLNFVGAGVTATGTGSTKTITISGGGGTTSTDFKYLELKAHNNASGAFSAGAADYELVTKGTTTAITPSQAASLLISIGGVIQQPNTGTSIGSNDGFCIDGSSIHFGANLTAHPDFIIYLQGAGVASIADNTVTGAKIALGSDASGDIMYYNGTDYARLAKGSDGQVLKLASGIPSWAAASSGTPEGTAILSTGETGTSKFLRIDGDNSCSWQVPPDTTYSVGDGGLTQNNFTDADHTKLDGIAASANNYAISADLLDEDNMSTNSATKVASQQSIKAYVDANSGGASADDCMYKNSLTISNAHTIAATEGAHSVGPITLNNTVTVNGRWVIS